MRWIFTPSSVSYDLPPGLNKVKTLKTRNSVNAKVAIDDITLAIKNKSKNFTSRGDVFSLLKGFFPIWDCSFLLVEFSLKIINHYCKVSIASEHWASSTTWCEGQSIKRFLSGRMHPNNIAQNLSCWISFFQPFQFQISIYLLCSSGGPGYINILFLQYS